MKNFGHAILIAILTVGLGHADERITVANQAGQNEEELKQVCKRRFEVQAIDYANSEDKKRADAWFELIKTKTESARRVSVAMNQFLKSLTPEQRLEFRVDAKGVDRKKLFEAIGQSVERINASYDFTDCGDRSWAYFTAENGEKKAVCTGLWSNSLPLKDKRIQVIPNGKGIEVRACYSYPSADSRILANDAFRAEIQKREAADELEKAKEREKRNLDAGIAQLVSIYGTGRPRQYIEEADAFKKLYQTNMDLHRKQYANAVKLADDKLKNIEERRKNEGQSACYSLAIGSDESLRALSVLSEIDTEEVLKGYKLPERPLASGLRDYLHRNAGQVCAKFLNIVTDPVGEMATKVLAHNNEYLSRQNALERNKGSSARAQ